MIVLYFLLSLVGIYRPEFQVGDCIINASTIEKEMESWEGPDKPYQILEIGKNNYRMWFFPSGLINNFSLPKNSSWIYTKVNCEDYVKKETK